MAQALNLSTINGTSLLAASSNLQVITVSPPFSSLPVYIDVTVSNTSADSVKYAIVATVVAVTTSSFTVYLSAAPNTGNYSLNWTAYMPAYTPPLPPAPVSGTIQLLKYTLQPGMMPGGSPQHIWPLQVIATSSITGLASQIFVYHAAMQNDPFQGDTYECVASLPQMSEIGLQPVTLEGQVIPYYRSNILRFDCRSAKENDALWQRVQDDTLDLIDNFNAWSVVSLADTLNISPSPLPT